VGIVPFVGRQCALPANLSRSDDADRAGVFHESAVFVTDRPAAPRSSNSDAAMMARQMRSIDVNRGIAASFR
jgi:hypothetical protein